MPTTDVFIIQEARKLARLQAKRRKLMSELRRVAKEIKHQKKTLRAVVASVQEWPESGASFKSVGNLAGE